jgi:hypothetical protein
MVAKGAEGVSDAASQMPASLVSYRTHIARLNKPLAWYVHPGRFHSRNSTAFPSCRRFASSKKRRSASVYAGGMYLLTPADSKKPFACLS